VLLRAAFKAGYGERVWKEGINMVLRALFAFLVLPFMAAGVVPFVLSLLDPFKGDGHPVGLVLSGAGLSILLWCVRDFYVSGKGTLAPWDPPKRLVIVGLYRYVRNPMYVGVLFILSGWVIVTASPMVFGFTLIALSAFHIRVVTSEEPWAKATFGSEWLDYKKNVPRWLPRLTGYCPDK
jgi:protein-S-isoprenylcysteine O-methyltransferase Ste14